MNILLNYMADFSIVWLFISAILGAAVGSFLKVVIYRLPVMLKTQWHHEALLQLAQPLPKPIARFDLLWPCSCCIHCQRRLTIMDNIPIWSFLWLKGRARCCGERIPNYDLLVEVTSAIIFMLVARGGELTFALLGVWLFLSFLLVVAVIDHHTQLLPDILTLPMLWSGLLFNIQGYFVSLEQAIIGAVAGYICLWSLFWVFKLLTGKDVLGYGDFKLLAALGAWLGWYCLPHVILIAATGGVIFTVIQRKLTKECLRQPLAFGPWLALGGAIEMLMLWESFANA